MSSASTPRLSTWQSLRTVARSWRLSSVALLSFGSGLPLGLVWIAIPTWMAAAGVDIKVVGLFSLAQAPWTFKVLWAPLIDRYPLPFLGRRRGWMVASQLALLGLGVWLAAESAHPVPATIGVISLAIAFASATQDIAYDGYAVEVLRAEEHGPAVGARVALYRAAMWISGRLTITGAARLGWGAVNLLVALLYVPAVVVSWFAPEPEQAPPPSRTLREAVFEPFVGLLGQHRALEILAFVALFKLSDNLTQALTGPFLVQMGYNAVDIGVAGGTVGLVGILVGTFLGGLLTQSRGLGPALWISGFLQIFSNLGYALVAMAGVNRPLMYGAQGFEYLMSGLGNGAFGVLLLRLTQKRFSVTQYALLSSLFTLPRVLAGPPAGLLADAIGWRDFFVFTVVTGIPGMLMLQRFAPWGVREPRFDVEPGRAAKPMAAATRLLWAFGVGSAAWAVSVLCVALAAATKLYRSGAAFDLAAAASPLVWPSGTAAWISCLGLATVGAVSGLATLAALVARERPGGIAVPGQE